jgi:aminoglycoside/choline kinase family phosphotransferase
MSREQRLENWLSQILKTQDFKCVTLAGDASARRYFRVYIAGTQYVVMDAPPPEIPKVFAELALILENQGLQVPKIIRADFEHGFLLLSDLGDRLYLSELNEASADQLYQNAFEALIKIQFCKQDLPVFDRDFFDRQLGIFEEWYLKKHCAFSDAKLEKTKAILNSVSEKLFEIWQSQPQVFVHRDYHSRNLMILPEQSPGILDFQDAMIGPITYDLVSLLQDCYIAWPRERVQNWVRDFYDRAKAAGTLSGHQNFSEFLHWFDLTGLQRHLKNLGIFARLHYRDNKSGYLKDIPQLLTYISETCHRYADLKPLLNFFETLQQTQETAEV